MYVQIHRQAPNWTEPNRNRKTCYKLYCLVLVSVSKMKKKNSEHELRNLTVCERDWD